ncbi:AbrB/MazE/SpoVT family DNA-binding domain-containing protein [Natrarchaeobius chitinivorans]|uniref:AbrB/MazE/SpoVT family DNA-binding domain-containing protein n=1 Tax=Natrarchaeobius chitinivorans TaxID=1679083 RepID=A0A3N6M2H9_NATCH|nr:AbrB/MazE/SpoVT family DNA-binding domain-containing protein [Natrarchaeobius chitinivorans]RQG89341.1 AbrB/MazE/SpoVT family DNA-binding domain-containing protein [Natrarchaeobius chitinivorans]
MAIETDDRGRVYLPKKLRKRHGERFRVVNLPTRIMLVPVDEDPLEAIQEEAGDVLGDTSIEDLKQEAREAVRADVDDEVRDREARQRGEE